jgi:uncharacterized protein YggE
MGTLGVRGQAVVPGRPDEVELGFTLTAVEQKPEDALSAVASRSQVLSGLLDETGVPAAMRSTTGVSVAEELEYRDGRSVHRGYRATERVRVRLSDASVVGSLMREAVGRAAASVDGPRWRLLRSNPAFAEACAEAARDARRRADAYALALGYRVGAVERATEPTVRIEPPQPAMRLMALEAAPDPELSIEAGDLDVTAAIEVVFLLEEP